MTAMIGERDAQRAGRATPAGVRGRRAASRCSRPTPSTGSAATPRTSGRRSACTSSRAGPRARPAAVMFFALEPALERCPSCEHASARRSQALLPGPVTLLLANRARRFAPACGPIPRRSGCACRELPERPARAGRAVAAGDAVERQPLRRARRAHARARCPRAARRRRPRARRRRAPRRASTVIDLRDYSAERRWHVLREGALRARGRDASCWRRGRLTGNGARRRGWPGLLAS